MKKFIMVLAAVLSLGVSSLAMANECAVNHSIYCAPVHRVVVVAPFHRPYGWYAWHRDHRFHRFF